MAFFVLAVDTAVISRALGTVAGAAQNLKLELAPGLTFWWEPMVDQPAVEGEAAVTAMNSAAVLRPVAVHMIQRKLSSGTAAGTSPSVMPENFLPQPGPSDGYA
jgi:hypothetical protein